MKEPTNSLKSPSNWKFLHITKQTTFHMNYNNVIIALVSKYISFAFEQSLNLFQSFLLSFHGSCDKSNRSMKSPMPQICWLGMLQSHQLIFPVILQVSKSVTQDIKNYQRSLGVDCFNKQVDRANPIEWLTFLHRYWNSLRPWASRILVPWLYLDNSKSIVSAERQYLCISLTWRYL